jgi:hypothetical protein
MLKTQLRQPGQSGQPYAPCPSRFRTDAGAYGAPFSLRCPRAASYIARSDRWPAFVLRCSCRARVTTSGCRSAWLGRPRT